MASTDEDKRRTQEASDGKFSSRGSGGEDENEAATVVDWRDSVYALHLLARGGALGRLAAATVRVMNRGDEAVDCDLLRIDFRASKDEEYRSFPVRLGPGARGGRTTCERRIGRR